MPESKDIREEILRPIYEIHRSAHPQDNWQSWEEVKEDGSAQIAFDAMDLFFEKRSMELLEWMSVNDVDCAGYLENKKSGKKFWYKGEWITKEQLFENFL